MSTITSLVGGDGITTANSMTKINQNFQNLNTDKIETSVLDTDTALTANSDLKVATQKAVKAYVDALGGLTTKTSGVSAGPTASGTQTVTHSLGRVPTVVRLHGRSYSDGNANHGYSEGTYNSTGNRNVATQAGSGAINPVTSTTYAIRLSGVSAGNEVNVTTGIVQNVTSTSFDIVWTGGGVTSAAFLWEAN